MNGLQEVLRFLLYSGLGATAFTLVILKHRWKFASQRYLAGLLATFALAFTTYTTQPLEWYALFQLLFPLAVITPFFLGPLTTLYIESHYRQRVVSRSFLLKQFAPAGLALVCFTVPTYLLPYGTDNSEFPIWLLAVPVIGFLFLIAYLLEAFRKLAGYRQTLTDNFSNLQRKELRWIETWVAGLAIVLLLDIGIAVLILYDPSLYWATGINAMLFIGFTWFLSYQAILQPPMISPPSTVTAGTPPITAEDSKLVPMADRLDALMREHRPYLDPNLGLADLSQLAGISNKGLSEVIKRVKQQNFYHYVNQHRVEEFSKKIKLLEHQNKTLLALAFESGFNSKATFNRIFKESTGMTPRQFVASLEKRSQKNK